MFSNGSFVEITMRGRGGRKSNRYSYLSNSIATSSSSATLSNRTDENSFRLSLGSSRSEDWNKVPGRPAWLPLAMWSNVMDSVGDAPRGDNTPHAGNTPRARRRANIENKPHSSSPNPQSKMTAVNSSRNLQIPLSIHNGSAPVQVSPRTDATCSTYNSHINVIRKPNVPDSSTESEPIKFDHWINRRPIYDTSGRPFPYHETQLIRQTVKEADEKIVWIYSYKNRKLFTEDNDDSSESVSPNTNRSIKSDEPRTSTEVESPFLIKSSKAQTDRGCDSWSCYDTRLSGSPRYPNTCKPIYIPSLKLAATNFSLETVDEAMETDKSEHSNKVCSLNPHISRETLKSVTRWIDGSNPDSLNEPPAELSDGKSTVAIDNGEIDLSENEVNTNYKVKPPQMQYEQCILRNDQIDASSWITERKCITVSPKHPAVPKLSQWRQHGDNLVQAGNTACPDTNASCRLHAKSLAMLKVSPWDVYYPLNSPRVSEVLDISLTRSEHSERGRVWTVLSHCFCKCFACRK